MPTVPLLQCKLIAQLLRRSTLVVCRVSISCSIFFPTRAHPSLHTPKHVSAQGSPPANTHSSHTGTDSALFNTHGEIKVQQPARTCLGHTIRKQEECEGKNAGEQQHTPRPWPPERLLAEFLRALCQIPPISPESSQAISQSAQTGLCRHSSTRCLAGTANAHRALCNQILAKEADSTEVFTVDVLGTKYRIAPLRQGSLQTCVDGRTSVY